MIINHVTENYWRVQAKILGTSGEQFQGVGASLRVAVENARLDWDDVESIHKAASTENFFQRCL